LVLRQSRQVAAVVRLRLVAMESQAQRLALAAQEGCQAFLVRPLLMVAAEVAVRTQQACLAMQQLGLVVQVEAVLELPRKAHPALQAQQPLAVVAVVAEALEETAEVVL
jgi:hypothetical protein